MLSFFRKPKNWEQVIRSMGNKAGFFAVIDWAAPDYFLGTSVKRIIFYMGNQLVGSTSYSEAREAMLRESIPVVDLTEGKPCPDHFTKLPRKVGIIGRLNLAELPV